MIRSRLFSAAMVAAIFSSGVALSPSPALADSKPTARPEIGKPIQDALGLIGQGKLQAALADIQAAEAVPNKTAYESYILEVAHEKYYLAAKDYPNTVKAAEALIASGQLPPEQQMQQLEAISSIEVQLKDCPRAVDAINRYYKAGGPNPAFHRSIISCYYSQGDLPKAAAALRALIQASGKPTEDDLKNLMGIEYKSNPSGPGYYDALKELVVYYPNKGYWHDLILIVTKKPGYSDKLELDLDQLKIATQVLDQPSDFSNAAELAVQGGFPGLAKQIMDAGFAAGVLGQGPGAAHDKKLSDTVAAQAVSDKGSLAGETAQAKTGSALLKLGDAFASYGEYSDAINAYQKAISAGGFKTPLEENQAKLHLGLAYLNAGQKAKDALKAVTGADGTADLAQLWIIKGGL
jgi:tetratricopeptide (TPR) repeat protein